MIQDWKRHRCDAGEHPGGMHRDAERHGDDGPGRIEGGSADIDAAPEQTAPFPIATFAAISEDPVT